MRNWLLDSLYESYVKTDGRGPRREAGEGPPVDRRRPVHARARPRSWASSTRSSTARTSRPSCKTKFGEDVKFDTQVRQEEGRRTSISRRRWACFKLWANMLEGRQEEGHGKDVIGDRLRRRRDPAGQARAQPVRRAIGSPIARRSARPSTSGRRQARQGGGAARQLARRIGRGQRDHPQRHQAGQGQEAVGRSRWAAWPAAAATTSPAAPTRSSPTPRRSPPRSAWSAASSPPPTCGTRSASPGTATSRGANAGLLSSDARLHRGGTRRRCRAG